MAASFIQPAAIAVTSDGSLLIADSGAHNIRRLQNGVVSLVAGISGPGDSKQTRTGGLENGPAATARFNGPSGLALGRDGTIYIADSGNHCVRKLENGIVTTFAGSAHGGKDDGRGSAASFNLPKSLASDSDGNLYVADFGNGIRKITPTGEVSTMNLPSVDKKVYAVSARGGGSSLVLAYTDAANIYLVGSGVTKVAAATHEAEPLGEGRTIGLAYSVTILSDDAVAVTDVLKNDVRFVRFPNPPFVSNYMARSLAGGRPDATGSVGGFRDGTADQALTNTPLGIVSAADGSIYFADAGNRRIRRIFGLDARGPVRPDLKGLVGPPSSYRVAFVGNSYMFSENLFWPESIPGQVETGLEKDGRAIGLMRKPYVSVARLDGAGVTELVQFIDAYLADGEADVVYLFINSIAHRTEPTRPGFDQERWRTAVPKELRVLDRKLNASGTRLVLVYTPQSVAVSIAEDAQTLLGAYGIGGGNNNTIRAWTAADAPLEAFYRSIGIRMLGLTDAMRGAEEQADHPPYFQTNDVHFSADGATWVGRAVLQDFEQWRPWSRH